MKYLSVFSRLFLLMVIINLSGCKNDNSGNLTEPNEMIGMIAERHLNLITLRGITSIMTVTNICIAS